MNELEKLSRYACATMVFISIIAAFVFREFLWFIIAVLWLNIYFDKVYEEKMNYDNTKLVNLLNKMMKDK